MHCLPGPQNEFKTSPRKLSKTLQIESKAGAALRVGTLASYV